MKHLIFALLSLGYLSTALAQPVDEFYGKQWWTGYDKSGLGANIEAAWKVAKPNYKVRIAIIDSGIDYKHPDLKKMIEINTKEIPNNGIDDDNNGYVDDYYGYRASHRDGKVTPKETHGTHVAGIIAAEHNAIGIAGASKFAKIIPIRVDFTKDYNAFPINLAHAIDYAVDRGAQVINISMGRVGGNYIGLREAVARASRKNVIIVAASGNSSEKNEGSYPSTYSHDFKGVISVAASDKNGFRAYFSNYGKSSVDIYAPGTNIYSTLPGGTYDYMDGTSMAAPVVTGIVGLILAHHGPSAAKNMKARLLSTSRRMEGTGGVSSNGLIDAYAAITGQTSFNYVWKLE